MDSKVQTVKTILKYTFGIVPIVAGMDKYTNILTDWSQYVSNPMTSILPIAPDTFMMIVGVIEIVAGILVFRMTRIGAYVVSAWLLCIALSLIFTRTYVDVAVRDLVMAIGAFCLAQLSEVEPVTVKK